MQMPLKLGDQIPDFSLSDQLGVSRSNKQAKGRPLVLFFYPKDDTPGCTAENSVLEINTTFLNYLEPKFGE